MSKIMDLKTIYILLLVYSVIIIKLLNCIFPSFINCMSLIVGHIVVFILLAWFSFKFTKQTFLNQRIQIKDKAVFITGCDRGFGYLLAKRLDSMGFKVFAGCLFPSGAGAQELNLHCSKRLKTLELDVTNYESVNKAYEFVKDNLNGSVLWAVVNNAGVLKGAGVEYTRLEDFILCMEINCLGVVRISKAFLPLIKKSRGRIVNLTSITGRIGFPHSIAYITSKFAVTGFNDCLRHEFDIWGIRVIAIEPDLFRTSLLNMEEYDNMVDDCVKSVDRSLKEDCVEYFKAHKERRRKSHEIASSNLDLVIDDIERAICLRYPDSVYRPSSSYIHKLFCNIYLALPPSLRNILMNFVNRDFTKLKHAQKQFRNIT